MLLFLACEFEGPAATTFTFGACEVLPASTRGAVDLRCPFTWDGPFGPTVATLEGKGASFSSTAAAHAGLVELTAFDADLVHLADARDGATDGRGDLELYVGNNLGEGATTFVSFGVDPTPDSAVDTLEVTARGVAGDEELYATWAWMPSARSYLLVVSADAWAGGEKVTVGSSTCTLAAGEEGTSCDLLVTGSTAAAGAFVVATSLATAGTRSAEASVLVVGPPTFTVTGGTLTVGTVGTWTARSAGAIVACRALPEGLGGVEVTAQDEALLDAEGATLGWVEVGAHDVVTVVASAGASAAGAVSIECADPWGQSGILGLTVGG